VSATGTARPGGRTARTAEAVFAATIEELSERPYDAISVETIAARARVHKTTIYRRWHSKAELVTQALSGAARTRIPVPDTGSVDSDLRTLCRSVQVTLANPLGAGITRALLAGAAVSPEISDLMKAFWAGRQAAIGVIVDRAVGRGELPGETEPVLLMNAMAAPLYFRLLVTGELPAPEHADLAAAAALAAARAGVFTSEPR